MVRDAAIDTAANLIQTSPASASRRVRSAIAVTNACAVLILRRSLARAKGPLGNDATIDRSATPPCGRST
jgi:hypothetical protein